jgi:hypothetical protein
MIGLMAVSAESHRVPTRPNATKEIPTRTNEPQGKANRRPKIFSGTPHALKMQGQAKPEMRAGVWEAQRDRHRNSGHDVAAAVKAAPAARRFAVQEP